MKKLRVFTLVVLVSLLFVSWPSCAQQVSAVNGVVSDKAGGVMPGVTVELTNAGVGLHESTTTNDLGFYQFLRQAPGEGYSLTFTKDGFAKLVVSTIPLGVTSTETPNSPLHLAVFTQSIQAMS